MKRSRFTLGTLTVLAGILALAAAPDTANAQCGGGSYGYAPAPVYYAPPPVYYAPPVIVRPYPRVVHHGYSRHHGYRRHHGYSRHHGRHHGRHHSRGFGFSFGFGRH